MEGMVFHQQNKLNHRYMKKRILLIGSALCLFAGVHAQMSQELVNRMTELQKQGYMIGHQDDPFYGLTWEWERGRSDVRETCGDYPAVMGFDLGGIELGNEVNLDSVPFSRIREELIAHHERGGIVTLSWHPRNPLTGGSAWDNADTTVVRSILPGGSQHRKFLVWMRRVRDFVKTLRTKNDRPVPIIFRPWHENNGGWFWWGAKQCSPCEFKALWCMMQDYFEVEGFENLVWSYSPNLDGHMTEERFLERYPGDERVALIGLDAYQWGTEQDFVEQFNADLAFYSDYATRHHRLFAVTECGLQNLTDPTWWSRVLKPQLDKYPLSYALFWRNYKKEFFGPAPGQPNAASFIELYKASNTLFLKEISK